MFPRGRYGVNTIFKRKITVIGVKGLPKLSHMKCLGAPFHNNDEVSLLARYSTFFVDNPIYSGAWVRRP